MGWCSSMSLALIVLVSGLELIKVACFFLKLTVDQVLDFVEIACACQVKAGVHVVLKGNC